MIWFQAGVRSLVGWSSEALRAVDLVLFAGSVGLLARGVQPAGLPRAASVWMAVVLFLSYTAATEWGHCQPDTWMLLPALGALALRQRQLGKLLDPEVPGRALARRGVPEGVLWGLAFLVKPFVAFSAVLCLLLAMGVAFRGLTGPGRLRRLACDFAGVLAGGLLVGAASIGYLVVSGDWHAFLEASLSDWNWDYAQTSPGWSQRAVDVVAGWLRPWSALHLAALPLAVCLIYRAVRSRGGPGAGVAEAARLPLLAAFYLGWFFEANFLQRQFEYHVLPVLLLAWALVLGWLGSWRPWPALAVAVPAALVWLVAYHPLLEGERLSLWAACCFPKNADRLKDRLASNPSNGGTSWEDLRGVIQFLKARRAGNREVTCWYFSAIPVYTELWLEPSTRFVFPYQRTADFPRHRDVILAEAMSSPQRYVVFDLDCVGGSGLPFPQPPRPSFFRSGRYLVLDLGPPGERVSTASPSR
jgi:hypothetical protein